jgi:hypothetical protein
MSPEKFRAIGHNLVDAVSDFLTRLPNTRTGRCEAIAGADRWNRARSGRANQTETASAHLINNLRSAEGA